MAVTSKFTNPGSDVSAGQFLRILDMFFSDAVLKFEISNVVRLVQLKNISPIFSTFAVFQSGPVTSTVTRFVQSLNKFAMFVIKPVSKLVKSIEVRFVQFRNMLAIDVTELVSNPETSTLIIPELSNIPAKD